MVQSADDNKPHTCAPKPTLKRQRKADFWNEIPNSENTTKAIQKEHISELHKQTQNSASSQDKNKVKTLTASTFQLRRKEILITTLTPVSKIIETYPPLATCTISGVSYSIWSQCCIMVPTVFRAGAETRALIGVGGVYSYSCVLPDKFLSK